MYENQIGKNNKNLNLFAEGILGNKIIEQLIRGKNDLGNPNLD